MNNRLSELLKAHGVTQKEFAKRLGVTPQYISAICCGNINVSFYKMEEIAKALGVDVSDIIARDRDSNLMYCPHCGRPIRFIKDEGGE